MRYKIVLLLFLGIWALMIGRLYQISIESDIYYKILAKENIERTEYIKPVRGEIVDTDGNFLAINRIGFSLSIKPHLSRTKGELSEVIDLVQEAFPDINRTVMEKIYKKHSSAYNHKFIKVIDFVSYGDMMRAYPNLSINPHIRIDAQTRRHYPYGQYAAHIVGYTGRSNKKENDKDPVTKAVGIVGKSGLEKYYNTLLEGELGKVVTKVNARNKALETLEKIDPISNRNLILNLDMKLQKYIHLLLKKKEAIVVVMKTTGEVLSAVSNPSYDPNLFVDGISVKNWKALQQNLGHPFTNKFVHAVYPPGSVIKMGIALATSKYGKGVLEREEKCTGFINIGKSKHKFRCWSKWGHGKVELRRSIRESCDVFYYNKSLEVGIDNIAKTLKSIGLGVKTGVDLPSEYNGIIPDKAWKKKRYGLPWYMGETVIAAIGQGYDNITPMQVARHTAFLATGKLVTPMFAKKINGNPVEILSKRIHFNARHFKEIRLGMYDVCNVKSGTAYKAMHELPIVVAGKTGTAQVVSIPQDIKKRAKEEDLAYFKRSHAWITSYAPFKKPEYVVTVMLEHGAHGGSSAGPVAADIYNWLYYHGYFKKHPLEKVQAELKVLQEESNTTKAVSH
jgi:penicillin-binding protein 2